MAVTISLINMKGGVGKTTLAVNLAWVLARRNRVLLVDLDPQFNATQYLMDFESFENHRTSAGTIADVLIEPNRPRMTVTSKRQSRTTPLRKRFVELQSQTGRKMYLLPSELSLSKAVKNPQGVEYKLFKSLTAVVDDFDYIFIDCAPTDSVLTATALMASDYLLVPMKPDRFSILGYGQILSVLQEFRETYPDPHDVEDLGVVFTQVHGPSEMELECMAAVAQQASYIFGVQLPYSNSYLRSILEQTPLVETRFARRLTVGSIQDLVAEMQDRINELAGG